MNLAQMRSAMRADRLANKGKTKERYVLWSFRWAHYFATKRHTNKAVWLLGVPCILCYRVFIQWVMGVEIHELVKAADGLVLWHGQGLVVAPETVLGRGVILRHNTTIGTKERDGVRSAGPVLGDRVDVGANAVIIGPVTIGEGAAVGAGAVVTHDVAPGDVVVGNPARSIGGSASSQAAQTPPLA